MGDVLRAKSWYLGLHTSISTHLCLGSECREWAKRSISILFKAKRRLSELIWGAVVLQMLGGALAMSLCRMTDTLQLFKLSPFAKNFDNWQFLTYLIVKGRSYDPVSCAFISRKSLKVLHLGSDFWPFNEMEFHRALNWQFGYIFSESPKSANSLLLVAKLYSPCCISEKWYWYQYLYAKYENCA